MADRKPLTFRGTLRGISNPAVRPVALESGARFDKTLPDVPRAAAGPATETGARFAARPMPGVQATPDAQRQENYSEQDWSPAGEQQQKSHYEPESASASACEQNESQNDSHIIPPPLAQQHVPDGKPRVELLELITPTDSLEQLCNELIKKE